MGRALILPKSSKSAGFRTILPETASACGRAEADYAWGRLGYFRV
jgi:hypothetical protein